MFTPVLAKHTKTFNLVDTLSVGVDGIQRNFEPLQRQVETWRKTQITDDTAKPIFYTAFIDGKLEAPRTLLPEVQRLYFEPQYPEFSARTMWNLSNAFTSAFKKLDPVPQFRRQPSRAVFWLNCRHSQRWPVQGTMILDGLPLGAIRLARTDFNQQPPLSPFLDREMRRWRRPGSGSSPTSLV